MKRWISIIVLVLLAAPPVALIVAALALGKVRHLDVEDIAAFTLLAAPAVVFGAVWRFRRIFSNGWVRLGTAVWLSWIAWTVHEAVTIDRAAPSELVMQLLLAPAAIALACWWVAAGFRQAAARRQPDGTATEQARLGRQFWLLLVLASVGPAVAIAWMHSRVSELDWAVYELEQSITEARDEALAGDTSFEDRLDEIESKVDSLEIDIALRAEY